MASVGGTEADDTQSARPASMSRERRRDATLAVIGGHNVLFSAAHQKLYRLNDAAAYVWRCLEDGLGRDAVVNEMVQFGIERSVAETSVASALRTLRQLGLSVSPAGRTEAPLFCQALHLAGLNVTIRYATDRAGPTASTFRHVESAAHPPDVVFDVQDDGTRFSLFRNGHFVTSCSIDALAASLKAEILEEILERGRYELALHAAALVADDRALLVCGRPGAGKTTLSLALEHAGWTLAADDLALLDASGMVTGVPFATAVKAGGWKLLSQLRPDLASAPVWRRPDRKRVRYLAPQGRVSSSPRRVRWVVQLRRRPGMAASLAPIAPIEGLACLLKDAAGPDHRMTPAGFEALASLVDGAACYRLSYSRLDEAVDVLRDLPR